MLNRSHNLMVWYCKGSLHKCDNLLDQQSIYGTNPYKWTYQPCIEGIHSKVNNPTIGGIFRVFDAGHSRQLDSSVVSYIDGSIKSYLLKNECVWVRYYTQLLFDKNDQPCGYINEQLYFCKGLKRGCQQLKQRNSRELVVSGGEIVIIKNKMFKLYWEEEKRCLAAAHYGYAGGSYASKYGFDINEGGFYCSMPHEARNYIQATNGKNNI